MYAVDRTKWQNLTILEQMGNIASEVGRTFSAQTSGQEERAEAALRRALDLFDATTEELAAENKSRRLREVLRAKEEFIRAYTGTDKTSKASIENYFMQFALAARAGR